MKLFFDLTQALIAHENNVTKYKNRDDWGLSKSLVPVCETETAHAFEVVPDEDIFTTYGDLDILNLNDFDTSADDFGRLLDEVPLFRMRVEIYFDKLLERRHADVTLKSAVDAGFEGRDVPQTLPLPKQEKNYDLGGKLHHPILGHLSSEEIAKLYISTIIELRMLDAEKADDYGIKTVLGSHVHRLLDFYDGYIHGASGYARIDKLITNAGRLSYDPHLPQENYIESGAELAKGLNVQGRKALLQHYAQCEAVQIRRCKQLDRFLSLIRLDEMPEWVKVDIAQLLEQEAMKQVFASQYRKTDLDANLLEGYPALKSALIINAEGGVDDLLQTLLSQVVALEGVYIDAARRFVQVADVRQKELLLALS